MTFDNVLAVNRFQYLHLKPLHVVYIFEVMWLIDRQRHLQAVIDLGKKGRHYFAILTGRFFEVQTLSNQDTIMKIPLQITT